MISKRIFQIVAFLLVGLGIFGFIRAMQNPTSTVTQEVLINATPVDVFRQMTEKPGLLKWMGGIKELTADESKAVEVGSEYAFVFSDRGTDVSALWRVTQVVQWQMVVFEINNPGIFSTVTYQLEVAGKQTKCTVRQVSQYRSWVARALEPWIRKATDAKWKSDLERLKLTMEMKRA